MIFNGLPIFGWEPPDDFRNAAAQAGSGEVKGPVDRGCGSHNLRLDRADRSSEEESRKRRHVTTAGHSKVGRVEWGRIVQAVLAFVPFASSALNDFDREAWLSRLPPHRSPRSPSPFLLSFLACWR
jgi:hypothetical protein